MQLQRVGELLQHRHAAGVGAGDPVLEEPAGGAFARLGPQLSQVLLEVVGRTGGGFTLRFAATDQAVPPEPFKA